MEGWLHLIVGTQARVLAGCHCGTRDPIWSATLSPKVAAWCHAGLVIMCARSRRWSVATPVVSGLAADEPYDRGEQC